MPGTSHLTEAVPYPGPLRPHGGARPRLESLTTLRFFAALHVVLFHMSVTGIVPGGPWWFRNFAGIGYVGVNFFFVLSGFILVYTYGGPSLNARRFWRARFARIYPAYVLSLIVTAPFFFFAIRHLDLPFFAWSKQHLTPACILTLGLVQAWVPQAALTWNPVCWSLSVESFFYLVFPLSSRWTSRLSERKPIPWIAAFWMASLFFSLIYILAHPDGAANIDSPATDLFWKNVLSFNPLVRLPEFVTGMLTCRLYLAGGVDRRRATPLILAGLSGVVAVTLFAGRIPGPVISTGLLSPAFAAVICGTALKPAWTSFLEARWLVLLGNASYSLYLLHSAVMTKTFDALPHWPEWTRVAASLAAALGASLLAYRFVEEPARRLLRPDRTR